MVYLFAWRASFVVFLFCIFLVRTVIAGCFRYPSDSVRASRQWTVVVATAMVATLPWTLDDEWISRTWMHWSLGINVTSLFINFVCFSLPFSLCVSKVEPSVCTCIRLHACAYATVVSSLVFYLSFLCGWWWSWCRIASIYRRSSFQQFFFGQKVNSGVFLRSHRLYQLQIILFQVFFLLGRPSTVDSLGNTFGRNYYYYFLGFNAGFPFRSLFRFHRFFCSRAFSSIIFRRFFFSVISFFYEFILRAMHRWCLVLPFAGRPFRARVRVQEVNLMTRERELK